MEAILNDSTTWGVEAVKIQNNFKDIIANLLRQQDSNLIFQGFAKPADSTPAATLNHAYYVIESGTVFGVAAIEGQVLVGNGSGFEVRTNPKTLKEVEDDIVQLAGNTIVQKLKSYSTPINADGMTNALMLQVSSLIQDIEIILDDSIKDDVICISNLGIYNGEFYFYLFDITRNFSPYSFKCTELEYDSSGNYLVINSSNGFLRINAVINVIPDPGYYTNSTGGITVVNNRVEKIQSVFDSFNLAKASDRGVLQSVKSLDVRLSELYYNRYSKFYVSILGYLSSINVIMIGIVGETDGGVRTHFVSATVPAATQPTGIQSYVMENEGFSAEFVIDWTYHPAWFNDVNSTLRIIPSIIPEKTDVLGVNKKWNLFNINEVEIHKRLVNNVTQDAVLSFIANRIPIIPGHVYKSNYGFTYLNYYRADGVYINCVSLEGQNVIVAPANAGFVKPSGLLSLNKLESLIIQEVDVEDAEIEEFMQPFTIKSVPGDDIAVALSKGYVGGKFAIGVPTNMDGDLSLSGDNALYTNMHNFDYDGLIEKISFDYSAITTFNLQLGIGIIDQRGWGLIDRTFTLSVDHTKTHADYAVSQQISKGERLFIIADAASSGAGAIIKKDATYGFHYKSASNEINMTMDKGSIGFELVVSGKKYIKGQAVPTTTDFNNIKTEVSGISSALSMLQISSLTIDSPLGKVFRLSIDDSGVLSSIEIPSLGKILVMGNSYDVHDYDAGLWWGDFGMAASRKENDWKNRVIAKLKSNDIICSYNKAVLSSWETTYVGYNYATLDPSFVDDYVLIVIRIGENDKDTDTTRQQQRVMDLINYIKSKTTAPILFGGNVKIGVGNNIPYKAAIDTFVDVEWMDMTPAGLINPFTATLDTMVFGDDGVWHKISESSQAAAVAGHPNDNVFKAMADIIYPHVFNKLISL